MAKKLLDAIVILEQPRRLTIGPASLSHGSNNGRNTLHIRVYSHPNIIEEYWKNPSINNHWLALEEGYESGAPIIEHSMQELHTRMCLRAYEIAERQSKSWARPILDLTSKSNSGFELISESSGAFHAQSKP